MATKYNSNEFMAVFGEPALKELYLECVKLSYDDDHSPFVNTFTDNRYRGGIIGSQMCFDSEFQWLPNDTTIYVLFFVDFKFDLDSVNMNFTKKINSKHPVGMVENSATINLTIIDILVSYDEKMPDEFLDELNKHKL
jgi:hypothetical protein